MDFETLPEGWAQRPITDPTVTEGVVDLIVTEASRATGALYLLLCHADGRLLQPVALDEFPCGAPIPWIRETLDGVFASLVANGVPAVVLAVARSGDALLGDHDHALRVVLTQAAEAAGLAVLGCAVAVPGRVLTFPAAPGARLSA